MRGKFPAGDAGQVCSSAGHFHCAWCSINCSGAQFQAGREHSGIGRTLRRPIKRSLAGPRANEKTSGLMSVRRSQTILE